MFASRAIRITDPDPYGEVTLVPSAITGRSESQLARAMAEAIVSSNASTASQALQHLRDMFPDSPLTIRVAALNALMRR
jgi:hypothetical protein